MSEEFKIDIISPDKRIYSGNTKEVVLPCFEGQVLINRLCLNLYLECSNESISY